MQSDARGFAVVDTLRWRAWKGFVADVWHVECDPDARGTYLSPDPRLFVVLDINNNARLQLTDIVAGEAADHAEPFSMAYVPAGVPVESRAFGVTSLRHLDIHLPEAAMARCIGREMAHAKVERTRLKFHDERVAAMAKLIAEECLNPAPLLDVYGEALLTSLVAALFDISPSERKGRPSLSRSQLNQSLDYIDAHCLDPIRLHDLASRLGLSESHFSHAFKASTGVPPLRWQMEVRIRKVKQLLKDESVSLTEIAATAGFSDQAHLTRAFKRVVGLTPAEWRRNPVTGE
jgi:AraC-like DNA-binding protein